MKNFFISGVSPEKKRKLQEADVAFCDLAIDGADGVVIDEESFQRCLAVLEAEVVSEEATSLEGIVKITLRQRSTAQPQPSAPLPLVPVVVVDDRSEYSCDHWRNLSKAAQEWAKSLRGAKKVILGFCILPGMLESLRLEEGEIYVLYGKTPWSSVLKLVRDDELWVEYIPGGRFIRVYGFSDCCSSQSEMKRFSQAEKFIPLATASSEEAEKIKKEAREKALRVSREAYVRECSARFEKTVAGTREAIIRGNADVAKLQQELTRRIREVAGAERKLNQLLACKGGELEKYAREFDALLAVPGVEDVQAGNGVIKVLTEHIYITPEGCADTFDIGKFRMEIYTAGSNGGIRFFNLTRQGRGDGYNTHHPHVQKDGAPCLGNIKEMIPSLIAEYEFSAVAQIGLQYLKSVNTDDSAGKGIFSFWPKKKEG